MEAAGRSPKANRPLSLATYRLYEKAWYSVIEGRGCIAYPFACLYLNPLPLSGVELPCEEGWECTYFARVDVPRWLQK